MRKILRDFSKGMTDYLFNSPPEFCEVSENLLIEKDGSLQTVEGSEIYDQDNPQIPQGNQRISKIINTPKGEVYVSAKQLHYIDGTFQTVSGPASSDIFSSATADTVPSIGEWNDQFFYVDDSFSTPVKFFANSSNDLTALTSGLPNFVSSPVLVSSTDDGAAYIYAFMFRYSYTVKNTTYYDYSSLSEVQISNATDFSSGNMSISNIQEVINGVTTNYDTANIEIEIYRTLNSGTDFYLVDRIPNGQTVYTDTTEDSTLINNEAIFSDASSLNDPPPPAKYIAIVNNVGWYAHVKEGNEVRPNRVRQSVQSDPDSCPETFYIDLDEEITGISYIDVYPIVFTKTKVYRFEGFNTIDGAGFITSTIISDNIGCVSNGSIVRVSRGLYWFSDDGVYYSDGYSINKVSPQFDGTYKDLIETESQRLKIHGHYDRNNQRIYWAVQRKSTDNDSILIFDITHSAFGFRVGTDSFAPTAILFKGEDWLRADKRGYVLKHSDDVFTDPKIDTAVLPANWSKEAIIYKWKHLLYDFGEPDLNKYNTRVAITGYPQTNVDIQINSYRNGDISSSGLYPIKFIPLPVWGDPSVEWGDPSVFWNQSTVMNQVRRFPKGSLRCKQRQVELTNAYTEILSSNSDTDSYVTINSILKIATIVNPSVYDFGANNEDYYLEIDGKEYLIKAGTSDTLTLEDDDAGLPDGVFPYKINGYNKGQRIHLSSLTLTFEILDDDGGFFQGEAST